MNRVPDWEALHQLNFTIGGRISNPLNEALNALALADLHKGEPEALLWRDKAQAAVANVLNLYQAWSAVIQFQNGLALPPNAIRPFPVQALLDWLTIQLELMPPAKAKDNLLLDGNQACIQEALLLLYSAAATQGTNVHLHFDFSDEGGWFRIRFSRFKALPASLDALIENFKAHWRSQDYAFELSMAQNFIRLSGSQIALNWLAAENMGEFAFFIAQVGFRGDAPPAETLAPNPEHARFVANINKAVRKTYSESGTFPPFHSEQGEQAEQAEQTQQGQLEERETQTASDFQPTPALVRASPSPIIEPLFDPEATEPLHALSETELARLPTSEKGRRLLADLRALTERLSDTERPTQSAPILNFQSYPFTTPAPKSSATESRDGLTLSLENLKKALDKNDSAPT